MEKAWGGVCEDRGLVEGVRRGGGGGGQKQTKYVLLLLSSDRVEYVRQQTAFALHFPRVL